VPGARRVAEGLERLKDKGLGYSEFLRTRRGRLLPRRVLTNMGGEPRYKGKELVSIDGQSGRTPTAG
jgi:hypothetical protein